MSPMSTDPKPDPTTQAASTTQQAPSEPRNAWLVMCVHCGQDVEVPLPFDCERLARFLARVGWFVSVLTPPGQGPEVPIVLGALCSTCAPTVFPPEVLAVAEQRRQQLLQAPQGAR